VALEVGIVGPSGSGKTSLFTALTKAGGGEYGKTNVGVAPIADERLGALAQVVQARKVTPATIRVQDIPGSAAFGELRQVDALLVVVRAADELESFELELLVADRDHVERRLERVEALVGDRRHADVRLPVFAATRPRQRCEERRLPAAGRADDADLESHAARLARRRLSSASRAASAARRARGAAGT